MTQLDSELEPGLGIFDRRRLFSDRAIWTFFLVGLAALVMAMSGLWDSKGFIVDVGATGRYIVVGVAAVYGLVLGWMIFPRIGMGTD